VAYFQRDRADPSSLPPTARTSLPQRDACKITADARCDVSSLWSSDITASSILLA
jgi:hypothetical protein